MSTIKDDLNTIITNQAAITAAIAAIPASTGATVDLTPVLTAVATANTGIAVIEAQLQPTA